MKIEKEQEKEGMKVFRARQTYTEKEVEHLGAMERMENLRLEKRVEVYDYKKSSRGSE